jgi:hypothetical protein
MNRSTLDNRPPAHHHYTPKTGDCTLRPFALPDLHSLTVIQTHCRPHLHQPSPALHTAVTVNVHPGPRRLSSRLTTTLRSPTRPWTILDPISAHSLLHDTALYDTTAASLARSTARTAAVRPARYRRIPRRFKHSYTCVSTPHHPAAGRLSSSQLCTAQQLPGAPRWSPPRTPLSTEEAWGVQVDAHAVPAAIPGLRRPARSHKTPCRPL